MSKQDPKDTPAFRRGLAKMIAYYKEPHRYVICHRFPKDILGDSFYDFNSDDWAVEQPNKATLIKCKHIAIAIAKALDWEVQSKDGFMMVRRTKNHGRPTRDTQVWKVKPSRSGKTWKFIEKVY